MILASSVWTCTESLCFSAVQTFLGFLIGVGLCLRALLVDSYSNAKMIMFSASSANPHLHCQKMHAYIMKTALQEYLVLLSC